MYSIVAHKDGKDFYLRNSREFFRMNWECSWHTKEDKELADDLTFDTALYTVLLMQANPIVTRNHYIVYVGKK